MKKCILILWGGGHLAETLARVSNSFEFAGRVILFSRNPEHQALAHMPDITVAKDLVKLQELVGLDRAVVLATRPFTSWNDTELVEQNQEVLRAFNGIQKFIMISSTGVYRDHGHPYLVAEQGISSQLPTLVLRCAGLYDQNKGPHRFYLRKERVSGAADATINLIHYDDVARVLGKIFKMELMGAELAHNVYDLSDGSPLTRDQIHKHLLSWGGAWARIGAPEEESDSKSSHILEATKIWRELKMKPLFESFLSLKG